MPAARVNDIDITYRITGAGEPLVMIMGITGSKWHWLGFDRRLGEDFLAITFDNRGVGETTAPEAPYTIPRMAEDTMGLLDAIGIDRAHVFGVSMGGMIAQEIALRHPGRVKTLVLGCTHFGGTGQILPPPEVYERAFIIAGKGAEQATRDILSVNLCRAFMGKRPDVVEELVRYGMEHRMKKHALAGQLAAVSEHDTASRLQAITAPTLLLAGDADELIPPQNSIEMAERIPQAQITFLPGVGHMFWVEAPEEAAYQITRFVRGHKG
jgi:pimeloyl-ACP methyl ester carboxylesterase